MWICDGQRLHRYDPETVQPLALVELGIECGQVTATADLTVAWAYNEDDGQSGTETAAFIDPATNQLLATVDLPVDVGVPVVLDEVVFFCRLRRIHRRGRRPATWAVTATPDLGRATGGSLVASDDQRTFVATDGNPGPKEVLVVDASTFAVTDTIEPLGNNAVALLDGSHWTGDNDYSLVPRHDLEPAQNDGSVPAPSCASAG